MILVVCGVSGAGKTTVGRLLAERLGVPFLDADDHHPPENVERMRSGRPLSDANRQPWLDRLARLLEDHAGSGAVLACSALKRAYRDRLGVDQRGIVTVFLEGDRATIAERLSGRRHAFMPAALLDSQFAALEPPSGGIRVRVQDSPETICRTILDELERRRAPDASRRR